MVYLAFAFSGNPTENTRKEREMALKLMDIHPDWFILSPHFAIDVLLDGCLDWGKRKSNFTQERRIKAGMMCLAFLFKSDIMILGCEPTYKESPGVTWEYVIVRLWNESFRRDNPIKIITLKEALKIEDE
jgi:hypothetical protein